VLPGIEGDVYLAAEAVKAPIAQHVASGSRIDDHRTTAGAATRAHRHVEAPAPGRPSTLTRTVRSWAPSGHDQARTCSRVPWLASPGRIVSKDPRPSWRAGIVAGGEERVVEADGGGPRDI
jgi:hypothetical protein